MSIIWKYLDKRSAVVDALKDYGSMKFIIEHTDDEIKTAYEKMGGAGSPQFDGMPHTHNPHAVEDRMIKGIEEIDVLKERYRQAMEYMAWFLPAWEELSEDERYVLETFYSDSESQTNAVYDICDRFGIEDHQYGDEMHTGIPLPSSGKKRGQRRKRYERPFKKMERQHSKHMIRKELGGQ